MKLGGRQLICERCSTAFGCSRDDPAGCWCAREAYRLPLPPPGETSGFADCLCPSCLRAVAELSARSVSNH